VIRYFSANFRINPDPDACRICPKMLWMHYLVGVSHFAKYGKQNRPSIVWEILQMSKNALFLNGGEKSDPASTSRSRSPPTVRPNHFCGVTRADRGESPLSHVCQVWSTSVSEFVSYPVCRTMTTSAFLAEVTSSV